MVSFLIQNRMATKEQLEILKLAGVVPTTVAKCELITKSNAERLVAAFLNRQEQLCEESRAQLDHIQIAHECFGGCSGLLYYTLPATGACIECLGCGAVFTTEDFCRHSHSDASKSCHWGFDSSNWYFYLHPVDGNTQSSQTSNVRDEQIWTLFVENSLRQTGR